MQIEQQNRLKLEHLEALDQSGWVQIQVDQFWNPLLIQAQHLLKNNAFIKSEIKGLNADSKIKQNSSTEQIRNDIIHWIEKSTLIQAEINLNHFLMLLKNDLKNYFRIGLDDFETHYAIYDKNHFYQRHSDQKIVNNKRIFSFVYYLNYDWKTENGGQLVGYQDNSDQEIFKIQPEAGCLIIFKSQIEHQVLPSHSPRYSVTGWFRIV